MRRISIPVLIWIGIGLFLVLNLGQILADPTVPAATMLGTGGAPVIVTEFQANNQTTLTDEDGHYSDWIELYNRSAHVVNLAGWSLTNEPERPDRWRFEELQLAPGEYLVVFASGKNRFVVHADDVNVGPRLHTNFRLAGDGGYLALHPPTARRYLDGSIFEYPAQPADQSYGHMLDAEGQIERWNVYFGTPTPGRENDPSSAWQQVTAPVVADLPAGFYDEPIRVVLQTDDRQAVIHYTTDGSLPTESNGLLYSEPLIIDGTTPLRAAAIRPDYRPGPVMTHTYIFVDDVLRQGDRPPGFPATWGVHDVDYAGYVAGAPRQAIYGMDPRIVGHPVYGAQVRAGLLALPTLSLVMPPTGFEHLYGNTHGRGEEYEEPISLEILYPTGWTDTAGLEDAALPDTIQIDAGVRIHGGAGRWSFMPKHSFRLYFRSEYGASRLRAPIFADTPVDEFNRLVLRAGSDRSFVGHPPAPERPDVDHRQTTYTRDEWARASQIAMSGYGSHGLFAHLYINGVYWGIYNLVERLDTDFAAAHLGGRADEWFSVTQAGMRPGMPDRFLVLLDLAQAGGMEQAERYATMMEFIDPIQFSDYVILQWYSGNRDWPENNWTVNVQYPAGRNLFFVWDSEDTWHEGAEIQLGGEGVEGAPFPNIVRLIFDALWENSDFRIVFADRLYANLHHDGALTDSNSIARWDALNAPLEDAIAAESARWGYVRYEEPITPDDWRVARDAVTAQMQGNGGRLLELAREAGFYPALEPPLMGQQGGAFDDMLELTLAAHEKGRIFYTLDGTDPRETITGDIGATAHEYRLPIALVGPAEVRARVARQNAQTGTWEWSAENRATFFRRGQAGDVAISEIMYNPVGGNDFEFVEIWNRGELAVDLSGAFFEGIDFRFQEYRRIEPDERMVLVRDFGSFRSRYAEAPIHGVFGGGLSNQGERLALYARDGALWDAVEYGVDGRWPISVNGAGDSLVRRDFGGDPNHPASWQASSVIHGSPGAADGVVMAQPSAGQ